MICSSWSRIWSRGTKKRRNSKNLKKLLAFSKKLLYNITCVKETQKQNKENARLAQLVEHLTLNQGVQGSNP